MAHVELSFLGYFEAKRDGLPMPGFATHKARALLAYLAVEAGRPHSRERLASLFWPERSEEQAHTSLRNALTELRHTLGEKPDYSPILEIERDKVQLNRTPECWIDVAAFEELVAEAEYALEHTGDLPSAMRYMQEAISLYRGISWKALF